MCHLQNCRREHSRRMLFLPAPARHEEQIVPKDQDPPESTATGTRAHRVSSDDVAGHVQPPPDLDLKEDEY